MKKRVGSQTVKLLNEPKIVAAFATVGPREGQGPLGEYFDLILKDEMMDMKSYEKAESEMMRETIERVIKSSKIKKEEINYLFAGDLLNQIIASSFVAREINVPFFGLYGACSTMVEALSLGSMIIDGGFAEYTICSASSHFCSAERQFRFPLEYGTQRKSTAQWTVTGCGAMILSSKGENFPKITMITTGVVKDYGIKDASYMGAAMAPAAVDTIYKHFLDTKRDISYYDAIITGDLGEIGKEITEKLLLEYNLDIRDRYIDCGDIIFNNEKQGTDSGGSGCGCIASVASGYFYKKLLRGEMKKILLVATGALMSTTSSLQGESIPGIAHAIAIER